MKVKGPANKRTGSKTGKAPHPGKPAGSFGNKTAYAEFSKTNIGTGKK